MLKLSVSKERITTKKIVTAGLLTGISIILTRLFSIVVPLAGLPTLRIGFGDIPIILSGILMGPTIGALTGIVSDVIGFMINPMGGPYFPGFTISAALRGAIPGLIYLWIKGRKIKLPKSLYSFTKILICVAIPYFVISLGLNTFWLSIMFDKGFLVFLPGRIFAGLVIIPLHSLIIFTLSKFFKYIKI